jgi:hypothetical protein
MSPKIYSSNRKNKSRWSDFLHNYGIYPREFIEENIERKVKNYYGQTKV